MSVEIIKPKVNVINFNNIVPDNDSLTPSAHVMEYVCRVCYNSYDKMTDNSYISILSGAAKRNHRSIFDFSNIQFVFKLKDQQAFTHIENFFSSEKYLNYDVYTIDADTYCIKVTGSIRAFIELLERYTYSSMEYTFIFNYIFYFLKDNYEYIITNWPTFNELTSFNENTTIDDVYCECTFEDIVKNVHNRQDKVHRKILVEFVTDRGLHNEAVRHRVFEHMAESQRYVRYGTGKNPLKICVDTIRFSDKAYINALKQISESCYSTYKSMLNDGYAPQLARAALPMGTALKSFIYGNMGNWEHFFRLRSHSAALPMMQEVSNETLQQFINKGLF